MFNFSTKKIVLIVSFCLIFSMSSFGEENIRKALVWPELLEHAKLKIVWENELPFKEPEQQDRLYIAGDYFYSFTNDNYIVSLNKDDGSFIFGRSYAPTGFPVLGFELYGEELFSIIGNQLVEIRAASGIEISQTRLQFGVSCPAVRNYINFYIAGVDRRVHVLTADKKIEKFKAAADDDSIITSIVTAEDMVIFGSETGKIVAMNYDEPKLLWQFKARSGIAGSLVLDDLTLFAASRDTNVYMIDATKGQLIWKFQTEAILDKNPTVTKNAVYQYVWGKGLTAIDRVNGQLMWKAPGGLELLAEDRGIAYVIKEDETLSVMDNKKGKELYSVNFSGVTRYVANTEDSKIYIGDDHGRVACIKPVE
ncbi:MAG: outer membrane protein assembly factor BamB family protein [Planctomycetota bacterium]|jgi:outer membrane protein assembly factor BamB